MSTPVEEHSPADISLQLSYRLDIVNEQRNLFVPSSSSETYTVTYEDWVFEENYFPGMFGISVIAIDRFNSDGFQLQEFSFVSDDALMGGGFETYFGGFPGDTSGSNVLKLFQGDDFDQKSIELYNSSDSSFSLLTPDPSLSFGNEVTFSASDIALHLMPEYGGFLTAEIALSDIEYLNDYSSPIEVSAWLIEDVDYFALSGDVFQGDILTIPNVSYFGGTLEYNWLRNGSKIEGADSEAYVLTQDDVGQEISVNLVIQDEFYGSTSIDSEGSFTILNVNDVPLITSSENTTFNEDGSYTYTLTASDIDAGDTLTLSAETKPDWLSFDADTGILSGTPTNDTIGDHSVVLRATDGSGAYAEQSFTVSVSNLNDDPTFSYPSGPLLAGVLAPDETIAVYLHDLDDVDGITNAIFEYQWFADDVEIEGAESSSYKITNQDIDKKIGIKISYQDDSGFANTVYQKLDEAVVDESVSVFEFPILRYGATNGVPYFIGIETAKLRVRDDESFAYVYDAEYGAKVSSFGGMAVEYDGYVIPNFILEDRGISRSLTSDNQYFDAAYMHLDGVIPSIPDDIENGVSSLLIPLGASSDFLSLALENSEDSYNQFVSKVIQEIEVPESAIYGPGKTNWLKQIASDLQYQWLATSQEDQTIVGTDLDDNLIGGVGDDTIPGGAGNDTLNGGAGNDTLDGGEGDDEIYGGDGDDIIYTSAGNDIYDGGDGIDTVITDYINSPPTVGGNISLRNIENQFFIGETNITMDRSLDPESGNNHVKSQSGDDRVLLGVGDDTFELGAGKNYSGGGYGNDTIILSSDNKFTSSYVAKNISSSLQTGTEERINLNGKIRFEDVMDGGADVDTVELTDASDAFFLHDSFSGFHSSLTLSNDYEGRSGTARIESIENINAGGGDDIVDLTSPDYSLAGQNITVDGGEGDDTLWGSDANETLKGGNGDDELFGGAGVNELIGGAGADEFQFTKTSANDTIADFNISDGDTLKFFNTGGAVFDRDSIALNSAGDELSIAYGSGVDDALTISLMDAGLQLDDLTSNVLIIV